MHPLQRVPDVRLFLLLREPERRTSIEEKRAWRKRGFFSSFISFLFFDPKPQNTKKKKKLQLSPSNSLSNSYAIKAIGTTESELYDSGEEDTVFGREERAAEAAASAAAEAHALARRAGVCFTFGQRSFFGFLPLFLWLFGPTMLVATTVMLLCGLYFSDVVTLRMGGAGAAQAASRARRASSDAIAAAAKQGKSSDVESQKKEPETFLHDD